MSSKKYKDKHSKNNPFNKGYKKRVYIVDPKEGVVPIDEWGREHGQNLPGKITRTLHKCGGIIKGKPKLTKRGWK